VPPLLAGALIAIAGGAGLTLAPAVATAIAYGLVTVATVGAQFTLNKLLGKKPDKGAPSINQFTIKQPVPVRTRGYGRNKIAGAIFIEAAVPTTFAPLWLGIVFCEGPVDAIEAHFLNESNTGILSDLGGVNAAPPWFFYIQLESRKGDDSQAVSSILSTHLGWTGPLNGLCYTVMQCTQPSRPDKYFQYYFPNGVPTVRILARCCKVYDPRDGAQNWNDPATWTWSQNPALIILDYLTYSRTTVDGTEAPRGMGLPKSRMNLGSFIAFANVCDQTVATKYQYDGVGNVVAGSFTEKRYRCDGMYAMDEAPTEVLGRMLATCDGTLHTLSDGTVGIRGGVWQPPSVTITDDMILQVDVTQGNGRFEAYNQLRINFTATNLDYQVVEGPSWDDLDDQDINGTLTQDFGLPYVQSYSQARRLAKIHMAKGNPRWRYNSLVCNLKALNALGQDTVHVTHSLMGIDEDFLVIGFKLSTDSMLVELQLSSLDAEAYSWDATTEDAAPPGPSAAYGGLGLLTSTSAPTAVALLLVSGASADWGLASDPSNGLDEDWGMASDASFFSADLGLIAP
jgi:hypothetical protein